jgi:hypothetical protein
MAQSPPYPSRDEVPQVGGGIGRKNLSGSPEEAVPARLYFLYFVTMSEAGGTEGRRQKGGHMRRLRQQVSNGLLFTALAVCAACTTSASASRAVTPASHVPADQAPTVVTREIRQTRTDLHGRADVAYPQIRGLADQTAQTAINGKLRIDAEKAVADFFALLQNDQISPLPGTPPNHPSYTSTLDGSYQVVMLGPEAGSFRLFLERYLAGAAHPATTLVTNNFDLETGHAYSLAELFRPGVDYLGFLSDISRQLLTIQKVGYSKWMESGTTPVAANFTGWVLVPDGIEITFGQYQVAAYAEGMPRILVLNHAMHDLLAEGGRR